MALRGAAWWGCSEGHRKSCISWRCRGSNVCVIIGNDNEITTLIGTTCGRNSDVNALSWPYAHLTTPLLLALLVGLGLLLFTPPALCDGDRGIWLAHATFSVITEATMVCTGWMDSRSANMERERICECRKSG